MSTSFSSPIGPNLNTLPFVFVTDPEVVEPSKTVSDSEPSNTIDMTDSAQKAQSGRAVSTQAGIQNPRKYWLNKLVQLNQILYKGIRQDDRGNKKVTTDVIRKAKELGFVSSADSTKEGLENVRRVLSGEEKTNDLALSQLVEEGVALGYIDDVSTLASLYGKFENAAYRSQAEGGVQKYKSSLILAIKNGTVSNIDELKIILKDAINRNEYEMVDQSLYVAINSGIVKSKGDFKAITQSLSVERLPFSVTSAINHGIFRTTNDVSSYFQGVLSCADRIQNKPKTFSTQLYNADDRELLKHNSALVAAVTHLPDFTKESLAIYIDQIGSRAYFDLLTNLTVNGFFNSSEEFDSHVQILRDKIAAEGNVFIGRSQHDELGSWSRDARGEDSFSKAGVALEEAAIRQLDILAYIIGLTEDKPEQTIGQMKVQENTASQGCYHNAGYHFLQAVESGAINDTGCLTRYMDFFRHGGLHTKLIDGTPFNTGCTVLAVAQKAGLNIDLDSFFAERINQGWVADDALYVLEAGGSLSPEVIDVILAKAEFEGSLDKCVKIILNLVENNDNELAKYLGEVKLLSGADGIPPQAFNASLECLGEFSVIEDSAIADCRSAAVPIFRDIRDRNANAEREDQRIDLETFEGQLSGGLANLLAISQPITARLMEEHLLGRGYLPIVVSIFESAAFLKSDEVEIFKQFCSMHESKLAENPDLLVDLLGYVETYRQLGCSVSDFKIDLLREAGSMQEVTNRLGKTVVAKLCSPENLNIDIDFEKIAEDRNFSDEWDLRYLGMLVSKKNTWNEEQTKMFSLLLKAKFEGTLNGLVYPPNYGKYSPEVYGSDRETLEMVETIRYHNLNLLYEMEEAGLKIEPWLNPNEAVKPEAIASAGIQRTPNDIIRDFQTRVEALRVWLDNGYKTDSVVDGLKASQEVKNQIQGMYGKFWKGVEAELKPMLSKKSRDMKGVVLQLQELQRRHNDQGDKFKAKHKLFLDSVSKLFPDGNLPESVADMQIVLKEIADYNPPKQDDARMLLVHFWERDPGFDSFLGNYAGSCTALNNNSSAIFQFLLDIGTLYVPISELEGDHYNGVYGEADCTPKGYVRLYPAIREDGTPIFYLDSTDGTEAHANFGKMKRHILRLADQVGIDKSQIVDRLKSKDWTECKDKIGGVISDDYFHHFKGRLQSRFINPERKALLNKWAQEKGWLQAA